MLTTELVRATWKEGKVHPRYVKTHSKLQLERAEALVALVESCVGKTRGDLEESFKDWIAERTDFRLQRGLCKLLLDRAEFREIDSARAMEIRGRLFAAVAREGLLLPGSEERRRVLEVVAAEFNSTALELEADLFRDLKEEEIIQAFEPIDAESLLKRYNTALVQGILMRAYRMRIVWRGSDPLRLQALIRRLRFCRLIADFRESGTELECIVDGPLSLFQQSTRYGMQMALFFPALALEADWDLYADVDWEGQRGSLHVSSEDELSSHYRDLGTWHREEEGAFKSWLEKKHPDWTFSDHARVFRGREGKLWVPDFVLVHRSGFEVPVDWIGYWRKSSLEARLGFHKMHPECGAIVLVSQRLGAGSDAQGVLPDDVIPIKGVLPGKTIIERAERMRKERTS